ncbi:hypothetical protein GCM10020220_054810 [Nonomuraea rubra]
MILQAALLIVNLAYVVAYTRSFANPVAWLFLAYSVVLPALVAWSLWRWSTRGKRVRWATVALQGVMLAFSSSYSWVWLWLPLVVIVALLLPAASRWFDR